MHFLVPGARFEFHGIMLFCNAFVIFTIFRWNPQFSLYLLFSVDIAFPYTSQAPAIHFIKCKIGE